jgi:hypothetical protein
MKTINPATIRTGTGMETVVANPKTGKTASEKTASKKTKTSKPTTATKQKAKEAPRASSSLLVTPNASLIACADTTPTIVKNVNKKGVPRPFDSESEDEAKPISNIHPSRSLSGLPESDRKNFSETVVVMYKTWLGEQRVPWNVKKPAVNAILPALWNHGTKGDWESLDPGHQETCRRIVSLLLFSFDEDGLLWY